MFKKEVEITIKVPLRFEYEPPEYDRGHLFQPANICDLDWKDEDVQRAVITELYMPELHGELIDHVQSEIEHSKQEAAIAKWEDRQMVAECLDRR